MNLPEENQEKSGKTDDVLMRPPSRRDPQVDQMPPPQPGEDVLTEPVGQLTRRDGAEPPNRAERRD
ncbi:hypothetical protein [Micromonospora sp. NPDC049679]|uniref:hypothetical protein n=1 Tax=Micromonospora sp. NPDC049679 TaxID=3155920 RepID=UPI0033C35EFB